MAGTNTTQFIFIKHGNNTDEAIDYFNSGDTGATNFATGGPTGTNTGIVSPIAIQADLTGGFYYTIDPQLSGDGSADGQIHLGKIATPTAAPTTVYTVPDNSGAGNEFQRSERDRHRYHQPCALSRPGGLQQQSRRSGFEDRHRRIQLRRFYRRSRHRNSDRHARRGQALKQLTPTSTKSPNSRSIPLTTFSTSPTTHSVRVPSSAPMKPIRSRPTIP